MEPHDRRPYMEEMHRLLRPEGKILALLWNHGQEGGPPYDMKQPLVEEVVAGLFEVDSVDAVEDSPEGRRPEFLYRLRRLDEGPVPRTT